MTLFSHGDRIRYATTGDDGLPLVRYGWIGNVGDDTGPIEVLLDDELGGNVIDADKLEPVHVGNVTLTLAGDDLIADPSLRQALVNLWRAEAEIAGLQIASLHSIGTGVRDSSEGYVIAELSSGGEQYVLRAVRCPQEVGAIEVRADRPNRWEVL